MKPIVFCFPDTEALARPLAEHIDAQLGTLEWRRFPDRESLVTLHGDCAHREVIVLCTLTDPDSKMMALHFSAVTARELGATRVGLVAPYLGYMRQDQRFEAGQAVSAHVFARLLSAAFDWLITVDPHLHRIASLDEIFAIPAAAASAMPAVGQWIAANVPNPVLIGPDRESAQWAERVARSLAAPYIVLEKVRSGDRHVSVSAIDASIVRGRDPVIIDDIVSSGHTLAETLSGFTTLGITGVTCIAVHALFADGAENLLREAGARHVVSTNTVAHPTNAIDITPRLAAELTQLLSSSHPS